MKYIPLLLLSFLQQEVFGFGSRFAQWAVQQALAFATRSSLFLKTEANKQSPQKNQNKNSFWTNSKQKNAENMFLKSLFKNIT